MIVLHANNNLIFWQIVPIVDNLERAVNELNRQQVSEIFKENTVI